MLHKILFFLPRLWGEERNTDWPTSYLSCGGFCFLRRRQWKDSSVTFPWNHVIVASNKQDHKVISQRLMSCVNLMTKLTNQDAFIPSAASALWQMHAAPGKAGLWGSNGVGRILPDACPCCYWKGHEELRADSPPVAAAPNITRGPWMFSMYETSSEVLFVHYLMEPWQLYEVDAFS